MDVVFGFGFLMLTYKLNYSVNGLDVEKESSLVLSQG